MLSRRSLAAWLVLLAATQAGDFLTTWLGSLVGAREENPIVSQALVQGNLLLFALVKLVLVVAMVLFVLSVRTRLESVLVRTATIRGLQVLVVAFGLVARANAAGIAARISGLAG